MKLIRASEKDWTAGKGYSKRVLTELGELGIVGSFLQEVKFSKGDRVPLHHHNVQTEVFYSIGESFFNINGSDIILQAGDIVVCKPGDVHGNPDIPHDFIILVLKIDHVANDIEWDE
jgi:quercetin dioxygenase-like cupin family protein